MTIVIVREAVEAMEATTWTSEDLMEAVGVMQILVDLMEAVGVMQILEDLMTKMCVCSQTGH